MPAGRVALFACTLGGCTGTHHIVSGPVAALLHSPRLSCALAACRASPVARCLALAGCHPPPHTHTHTVPAAMGAGGSHHAELEEEAPGAQAHEGLLMKESETLKAWNPRYAILAGRVLSYWDTEAQARGGEVPRGRISLENCRVAFGDEAHPDTFVIETPTDPKRLAAQRSQTVMYFQAATVEELAAWVVKLRRASRQPWKEDAAVAACPVCIRPFDGLVRRHHCRRCGEVMCDACTAGRKPLPDYGYDGPVRVCRECMVESGPLPPEHERAAARADRAAAEVERRREAERDAAAMTGDSAEARRARLRQQFNVKR